MNYKLQAFGLLRFYWVLILCIYSCESSDTPNSEQPESSPYSLFFKHLKIENLSDTILVQNRTKIFLCPTAAGMYQEELIKKDLGKFYEKYGSVLDNPKLIQLFEKNNKVKILWINSGNEGELFQLKDSALHKNKKLENRLIKEKAFLIFDETPKSIDTVSLSVTIIYPKIEKAVLKTYNLSKSNENWKIDSQME